jgi:CheY-like chemotaxis protein
MLTAQLRNDLKIAIVDDQQDVSFVYSKIIEGLGYETPSVFNDGGAIVDAVIKNPESFDIVIMDYQMPEMNGIEAAEIIKRFNKDAKIVLATGTHSVEQEAIVAGLPILLKPFSAEQLADCLESTKTNEIRKE